MLQDLACLNIPALLLASGAGDANYLADFGLELQRKLHCALIVPSHPEPGNIRWHFLPLHLAMVHIRKDNWHARKEFISVCEQQFERIPDSDDDVWLSRRVSCPQIAYDVVPILSRRETHEVDIFRENIHRFRLPARQGSHQTLVGCFYGWDCQPITMEHQHRFFGGADRLSRPADGNIEPCSAGYCEESS